MKVSRFSPRRKQILFYISVYQFWRRGGSGFASDAVRDSHPRYTTMPAARSAPHGKECYLGLSSSSHPPKVIKRAPCGALFFLSATGSERHWMIPTHLIRAGDEERPVRVGHRTLSSCIAGPSAVLAASLSS